MPFWIMPPAEVMIEREPAMELRIAGIGAIEWIDGYVCIYLYALEPAIEAPEAPSSRVLKAKILGPIKNVPDVIGALIHCLRPWPGPEPQREEPTRGSRPTLVP